MIAQEIGGKLHRSYKARPQSFQTRPTYITSEWEFLKACRNFKEDMFLWGVLQAKMAVMSKPSIGEEELSRIVEERARARAAELMQTIPDIEPYLKASTYVMPDFYETRAYAIYDLCTEAIAGALGFLDTLD